MSRILIKNGTIVSMDRQTADLHGDLLVENERIAAISPTIEASDAEIIDASTMIVIPGLINSHIHTWETGLRGIAGDWTMPQYVQAMHRGLATHFRPDDINIANLMGALTSINSGITTIVDWCHNNSTPEHTDAAIEGLQESGVRAVFLHGSPKPIQARPEAFQRDADASGRSGAAAQRPFGKSQCAHHTWPRRPRAYVFHL